jgi:signal transduction histidine kinase
VFSGQQIASGRRVEKRVITGPVVLAPGILGQFYIATVPGRGPRLAFVHGNTDLVPRLPADLATLAKHHQAQAVTSSNGRDELRLAAQSFPGHGTVYATTSLADVNKTVSRLKLILAVGSAAATLLAGLGVALIMRRGLRPIETMAAQADAITAGDLTGRVGPHDTGTEVGRLGTALNGMLARIDAAIREREDSQEATRRFFADASHELRTPLASLRANAELYQQGALTQRPQVDEAMHRIASEAQRMSTLLDNMLRLARLDQHPEPGHEPVDVTALVHQCATRATVADPQRAWHTNIAAGLMANGDDELLRRAVDNLLAKCATTLPKARLPPSPPPGTTARPPSRSAMTAPASRPTSCPASSSASTAPRRPPSAPDPDLAWPSSARSPPPTTERSGPASTSHTGCALPSPSPPAATPTPPGWPPPAPHRTHTPLPGHAEPLRDLQPDRPRQGRPPPLAFPGTVRGGTRARRPPPDDPHRVRISKRDTAEGETVSYTALAHCGSSWLSPAGCQAGAGPQCPPRLGR